MAFFHKLLNEKDVEPTHKRIALPSPLSGSALALDSFPCPSHQNRMYGEGIVIQPSGYQLRAPFNAVIEELPTTCERVRLRAKNGIRLQIQIGKGTHKLMGEGFRVKSKEKSLIKKGEVILEFDLPRLKQNLTSVLCPVTVLNSDKLTGIVPNYHQLIAMEDTMMTLII